MTKKAKPLFWILTLVLLLSVVSAQPNFARTQELVQAVETHAIGGSSCAAAWGLGLGLAVAALSPCGVLCASLAWYDLALIGATCGW